MKLCFLPFEYTGKYSTAHLGHRVHLLHFELPESSDRAHNSIQPQQKKWDLPGIVATDALQYKSQRSVRVLATAISLLVSHIPGRRLQSRHQPSRRWGENNHFYLWSKLAYKYNNPVCPTTKRVPFPSHISPNYKGQGMKAKNTKPTLRNTRKYMRIMLSKRGP